MSLTVALREELAHAEVEAPAWRRAELMAMLDLAGSLQLRGSEDGTRVVVVVRCAQGGVARRLRSALVRTHGVRPPISRIQGGNLRGGDAFLVEVEGRVLSDLGVLDADRRPVRRDLDGVPAMSGYLAGALMVAGTLSGAGAPTHLEIRCPDREHAEDLAARVPGLRPSGERAVSKDGDAVADLLAAVGASRTFLAFDQGRMRRDLRRRVTRSVNADRANLRRAADAAATQIQAIEVVVETGGWDAVPPDLVDVALARVANPEASLAELGTLLDPPVGKATVHRRLQRLVTLAGGDGRP